MTCEICNRSQMDVVTYQEVISGIKINACTSCIRDIDIMVSNAADEFKLSIRHKIMHLIYDPNKNEKEV